MCMRASRRRAQEANEVAQQACCLGREPLQRCRVGGQALPDWAMAGEGWHGCIERKRRTRLPTYSAAGSLNKASVRPACDCGPACVFERTVLVVPALSGTGRRLCAVSPVQSCRAGVLHCCVLVASPPQAWSLRPSEAACESVICAAAGHPPKIRCEDRCLCGKARRPIVLNHPPGP
jgi:hypothetical protein